MAEEATAALAAFAALLAFVSSVPAACPSDIRTMPLASPPAPAASALLALMMPTSWGLVPEAVRALMWLTSVL